MKSNHKIAVLGGGGRTGKYVVSQLLTLGYSLKLLIRKSEDFPSENPLIETIQGDALDSKAIGSLTKGCQAVISTIGQRKDEPLVASQVTINVLNVMAEHGLSRYILIAGINVDSPFDKKSPETRSATEWMKQLFPTIHEDRQKSYSILTSSNVSWTMVRVPMIDFSDAHGKILVSLEDCPGNKISAADIAVFAVNQLTDDSYIRQAPFISNR